MVYCMHLQMTMNLFLPKYMYHIMLLMSDCPICGYNVLMLRCVVLAWHSTHSCWLNYVRYIYHSFMLSCIFLYPLYSLMHLILVWSKYYSNMLLFSLRIEFCWPCTVDFWQERALLKQTKTSLRAVMQSLIPIKWFHLTSCG